MAPKSCPFAPLSVKFSLQRASASHGRSAPVSNHQVVSTSSCIFLICNTFWIVFCCSQLIHALIHRDVIQIFWLQLLNRQQLHHEFVNVLLLQLLIQQQTRHGSFECFPAPMFDPSNAFRTKSFVICSSSIVGDLFAHCDLRDHFPQLLTPSRCS